MWHNMCFNHLSHSGLAHPDNFILWKEVGERRNVQQIAQVPDMLYILPPQYQTLEGIRDVICSPPPPKTLDYWPYLATFNQMPCWKQRKRFSTIFPTHPASDFGWKVLRMFTFLPLETSHLGWWREGKRFE